MHAFIINIDNKPIGYIQYYNKYDFEPEQNYICYNMPTSLAAIDFYIGETTVLGKKLSNIILDKFLNNYVLINFKNCLVDPDINNNIAIKTYKKSGFKIFKIDKNSNTVIMIKSAKI